jgi:Xaa-Pro aminopeptidase
MAGWGMPNGERRHRAVREWLPTQGLDAVVVMGAANLRYLTGFSGSNGVLLVGASRSVLVTDFRYASQAAAELGDQAELRVERSNLWEGLRSSVLSQGLRRIGIDRARATLEDLDQLNQATGIDWIALKGPVEELRQSKDEAEVRAIQEAAALASDALEAVLPTIRPGRTELEIAADLEAALRRRGSEWHPFPPIVASGARSALPHARPNPRPVERGDWLVLDFGAKVRGYCSDLTRTVVVGARATERQRSVYDLVRRAQRRAVTGIRPGMTGKAADTLAREVIEGEGFGAAFGHSLGHGLGLEVHEAPRLSQLNPDPLPAGAVVTVEPGVYLEGWGGVRIEDNVVLTAEGARCLSDGRTDLLELT